MKELLTQPCMDSGNAILAQTEGSSVLGWEMVTISRTLTTSPFFKWPTTSLLMCAWPRTLMLSCLAAADCPAMSGVVGAEATAGADFFFGAFFLAVFFALVEVEFVSGGTGVGAAAAVSAGTGAGAG